MVDLAMTFEQRSVAPVRTAPLARHAVAQRQDQPFDHDQLRRAEAALGKDRTARLLILFGQELPTRLEAIRKRIACNDLAGSAAQVQSLRSSALAVGARVIAEAARELEVALGPSGTGAAALHVSTIRLSRAADATLAALHPASVSRVRLGRA